MGEAVKLGAQFAVEQLKGPLQQKGFKVELVPYDDQATPSVGVANAQNVVTDSAVLAVVGHINSGVAIPASEVYKDAWLAFISPAASNPILTERGYPNVFRLSGRDDIQGPIGARFAASSGAKTVYVIHDKTAYGQGIAEAFRAEAEKTGMRILGFEGTSELVNFDPTITPIQALNPDIIYFAGIFDQGGIFFRQARDRGVRSRFLGPDGMHSPDLVRIAGKAVLGMNFTSIGGPISAYPKFGQFAAEFKTRFGQDPDLLAAAAYDATAIALKGIEMASGPGRLPSRRDVSSVIRDAKYDGVVGMFEFDAKGDPKQAVYFVLQITSDDPAKFLDTKEVARFTFGRPASR